MGHHTPASSGAGVLRVSALGAAAGGLGPHAPVLNGPTRALVVLGGALAAECPADRLRSLVDRAVVEGAAAEDVLAVLIAVAPIIGTARLVSVTPKLAYAVGYDIDLALETLDDAAPPRCPDSGRS